MTDERRIKKMQEEKEIKWKEHACLPVFVLLISSVYRKSASQWRRAEGRRRQRITVKLAMNCCFCTKCGGKVLIRQQLPNSLENCGCGPICCRSPWWSCLIDVLLLLLPLTSTEKEERLDQTAVAGITRRRRRRLEITSNYQSLDCVSFPRILSHSSSSSRLLSRLRPTVSQSPWPLFRKFGGHSG